MKTAKQQNAPQIGESDFVPMDPIEALFAACGIPVRMVRVKTARKVKAWERKKGVNENKNTRKNRNRKRALP